MTKVFHNGRQINGRFDSFKAKVRRAGVLFFRWSLISSAAVALVAIGAAFGSTNTVQAVEPQVIVEQVAAPVLDRIADCESGNGTKGSAIHYKNGQVVMNANTNGTIDIGKYQINMTYWGKKATELGLDLTKEADNKAMAEWLYANKGTGDWSASQKCWAR